MCACASTHGVCAIAGAAHSQRGTPARPYTDVRTLGENRRPVGDARAVPQEHAVGAAQLEVALRVVPLLLALAYVAAPVRPTVRQSALWPQPTVANRKHKSKHAPIPDLYEPYLPDGSDHCRTLPQYCGGTASVPTGTACCRQLARARTWRKLDRRQRKH